LGWLPSPKAERLWHAVALWTQSLPKGKSELTPLRRRRRRVI
jgi:hypothetical protein